MGAVVAPIPFAGLVKLFCFFQCALMVDLALGLELAERGQVFVDRPVEALLVERKKLELLGFGLEGFCRGEGGVDLGMICVDFGGVLVETEGEDVVFDRADAIESPTVRSDALGELGFYGSLRSEVFDHGSGERVMRGAVLVGHGGYLAGEAMATGVQTASEFAFFRLGTG